MSEHLHVDHGQRLFQAARQHLVGARRLGNAGRMVMGEDHRSSIIGQRRLDHFARVNAGLRQAAGEQFVGLDEAVLPISLPGWSNLRTQVAPVGVSLLA